MYPTPAETAYLAVVNTAVDELAADDAADATEDYPEQLLLARRAARKAAASALKLEARKFTAGQNPVADPARVPEIKNRYAADIPKFCTINPSLERFDGDFETFLLPGYIPGDDEQAFLDKVAATLDEFASDKRNDSTSEHSPYVITVREGLRKSIAKTLRDRVESFWTEHAAPSVAAENVMLLRGRYQALRDRLKRRLFNAYLEPPDERTELVIRLLADLPPPQDKPPPEKEGLYVQITKTAAVIRTVCDRLGERSDAMKTRAQRLRSEFLEKLHGVAVIGLELNFTDLARLTLTELRNEFFVLEAGRIKNNYVRQLGGWAGGVALVLLAVYSVVSTWASNWQWGYDHRSFLLAACGASIGTWASFSIRQVQFSFDDLVMVEESALDPPVRILFVIVLTVTACLLFWNGAINFEIGEFKTQPAAFKNMGSAALLVGLFAGLSERALATAISGRAAAFSKGIAGAT